MNGPKNELWRAGSSVWSMVTDREFNELEKKLDVLENKSMMKKYMTKFDYMRKDVGQTTMIIALQ